MISAALIALGLLVPPGPTGVTLTRYSFSTVQHTRQVHNRKTIRWLVHHFDALPPAPSGPVACPADNGSRVVARFHYRERHAVRVAVELTGCRFVRRGHVVKSAAQAPRLIHRLERLTR